MINQNRILKEATRHTKEIEIFSKEDFHSFDAPANLGKGELGYELKYHAHKALFKRNVHDNLMIWIGQVLCYADGKAKTKQIFGLYSGKLQSKKNYIREGKNIGKSNETTPWQQANNNLSTLINKKLDEGYKTVMCKSPDFVTAEEAKQDDGFISSPYGWIDEESIKKQLPSSTTTDRQGRVKPMLAQTFGSSKKHYSQPDINHIYFQPKLDGHRCLAFIYRNEDGEIRVDLITRQGKEIRGFEEIKNNLLTLYERGFGHSLEDLGPEPFIFDGELYANPFESNLSFQRMTSIIKAPHQYPGETDSIKYYVFDVVDSTRGFLTRFYNRISHMFADPYDKARRSDDGDFFIIPFPDPALGNMQRYVVPVITFPAYHGQGHFETAKRFKKSIKTLHDKWVQEVGAEGLIIRRDIKDKHSEYIWYEVGKRSHTLLKYKEFDEAEFLIDDVIESEKDYNTGILVCVTPDGKKFNVRPMGTQSYRRNLLDRREELINSSVTVRHFGLTDEGIPRFPIGKQVLVDI